MGNAAQKPQRPETLDCAAAFSDMVLPWLCPKWSLPKFPPLEGMPDISDGVPSYPWSHKMLAWQRTGYHFQPENNWINDPNGPFFYNGWYHFFYQYNPCSAAWGNITWGHAVSTDMVNWIHLPIAMERDTPSDICGVFTGSATLLPDGEVIMVYTGLTKDKLQVQNIARPADLSDPLLIQWVKYSDNPVMVPPKGIGREDFRDPTTAWPAGDRTWHIAIGSRIKDTGLVLMYETNDFNSFQLLDGYMHSIPGTGMWECVDFFPVSTTENHGLNTSVNDPGVKYVLKISSVPKQKDYYAIGSYDTETRTWKPDNPGRDLVQGFMLDCGKYYASKSFYDQNKNRRIIWSWIPESHARNIQFLKGWGSLQGFPRTVVFDRVTKTNLLQWPVEEINQLRLNSFPYDDIKLLPGSLVSLHVDATSQLDISATFEVDLAQFGGKIETDTGYDSSSGADKRGAMGPFGLYVVADDVDEPSEFTPIYFYISKLDNNGTFFCTDESRSTKASGVEKNIYGSMVPVFDGEKLSMRVLVDHSIVESFAQGGRTVITSRIYPTHVASGASRVFLFNNATELTVRASVEIWDMKSAEFTHYHL